MIDSPHDVAIYHPQHQEKGKREREGEEGRENRRDRIRDEGRKDNEAEFKIRN